MSALVGREAVRATDVPDAIRPLCPFEPDYADVFVAPVPVSSAATAEEWARATMEGAPRAGRLAAWRALCHLRLRPEGTPGHIAGWEVTGREPSWVRVEAASWFMRAAVVFHRDADRLWFVTFVRYESPAGRPLWTAISAVHRAVAPAFLAHGVRRVARRSR